MASNGFMEIVEDSVRGGFFLFAGNALSLIILAIGSIIVARLLGPESYGLLALSLAIPSFLAGFVGLGVSNALTRYLAKFRAEGEGDLASSMLKSGFLFKLLLSVIASAICFIFSDALATYILDRPEIGLLVKVASVLIIFQAVYTTVNSSFVGLDRMECSALIMNAYAVVKAVSSPSPRYSR